MNIVTHKICYSCKENLEISCFSINQAKSDGLTHKCKKCQKKERYQNHSKRIEIERKSKRKNREKRKEYNRWYRKTHKQKIYAREKEYNKRKPEIRREISKRYREKYREKVTKRQQNYVKIKRKTDPFFNMQQKLRSGFYDCLKRSNRRISTSFLKHLNCKPIELKEHIMSQFTSNMTWDKYLNGEIVIDHIIPFPCLDFNYEENIGAYANYKNLRPLWKSENTKKSTIDQKLGKIYKTINREKQQELNNILHQFIKTYNPQYHQLKEFIQQLLKNKLNIEITFPDYN